MFSNTNCANDDVKRQSYANANRICNWIWLIIIAAFVLLFALLSFGTGRAEELPKWNGIDYLLFCMQEGFMMGAVLGFLITTPIRIVMLLYVKFKSVNF